MAEATSALQAVWSSGRCSPPGTAGIILTVIEGFILIQIAAWPNSLAIVGAEAARSAECSTAPGPGRVEAGPAARILRIEPLKWWLISDVDLVKPDLQAEMGAVLDISQSRVWLRFTGPKASQLLNHVLPIDLSDAAFPDGVVASSVFHHVGVTLWREGANFNLILPRSFAASLSEILIESASQYGLEVV